MVDGRPIRSANTDLTPLAPVQLMLCLKTQKTGRINTHRWVYGSFARILEPNIVINVGPGAYPHHKAILRLWQEFHGDPLLGGATGAMSPDLGNHCLSLLNPLAAAQNMEYKAVRQLERIMGSTTGYMLAFHGSFSAVRYVLPLADAVSPLTITACLPSLAGL